MAVALGVGERAIDVEDQCLQVFMARRLVVTNHKRQSQFLIAMIRVA